MLFVMVPTQTEIGFDAFWALYPHRKAKKDAERAWRQLKLTGEQQDVILAALRRQLQERQQPGWHPCWPYPASWLRGARWDDEPEPVQDAAVSAREFDDAERVRRVAYMGRCPHDPEHADWRVCVQQIAYDRRLA